MTLLPLRLLAVIITSSLLGFQDSPPPEPTESTPACNNFRNSAHKCSCGKAMKCENGKVDDHPDPSQGVTWCSNYCRKDHCHCVGPCSTQKSVPQRHG